MRFTRSVADVERADLVVLPGTKATVEDLQRLRETGLDRAIVKRASERLPMLGICGGYQMLGERIIDRVESRVGEVAGLGLLPVVTTFAPDKVLRRSSGYCEWLKTEASGYEIHHGHVIRHGGEPLLRVHDGGEEGCRGARWLAPPGTGCWRTMACGGPCSAGWPGCVAGLLRRRRRRLLRVARRGSTPSATS